MNFINVFSYSLDIILVSTVVFFTLIAPYTKVEESFNIQAIHDIIHIGIDFVDNFDHTLFPGSVKRSCIGALLIGIPMYYLPATFKNFSKKIEIVLLPLCLLPVYSITKLPDLIMSRLLLGLINSAALIHLKWNIDKACNKKSKLMGIWFSLFTYPIFHLLYYSSRTLPNFIALPLVNFAISQFVIGDINRSITILCLTGSIFRFELIFFAIILSTVTIIFRQSSIKSVIISISLGLLSGGTLSYKLDSYFWNGSVTIPEIESFMFNVIQGNSEEWGVEPFYFYFTKYLPKMFIGSVVPFFIIPGIFYDRVNYNVGTIRTITIASMCYIILMSFNGHKESRFIIYSVPGLCLSSSSFIDHIVNDKKLGFYNIWKRVIIMFILASFFINFLVSLLFGYVSSFNYPGGEAVQRLNLRLFNEYKNGMLLPITVHWDVGTCMTGGSLFTQLADNNSGNSNQYGDLNHNYKIIYDKTEDPEELLKKVNTFDYWVSYNDNDLMHLNHGCEWILIDVIEGLKSVNYRKVIRILQNPQILIRQLLISFQTRNLKFFKNLLAEFIVLEPVVHIYENTCKIV